jgi:hypothetical protein
MVLAFLKAISDSAVKISNAGLQMIINMANGIANGIKQKTPALKAAMQNLGSAIMSGIIAGIQGAIAGVVSAIEGVLKAGVSAGKKFIESLSPSKLFAREVGAPISQGIAVGVTASGGDVNDAVTSVGKGALAAIQQTMAGIHDSLGSSLDLQPRITPVVDLTQAKKGFSDLAGLSKNQLINAGVSASSAASISAANAASAQQAGLISGAGTTLAFTQNNYSPTALSAIQIYRQTKNQLSIAKGALANANAS